MDKQPGWRRHLRVFGNEPERDVDTELDFHLEERTAEYIREGMSPADARAKAHARFGNRGRTQRDTLAEDRERHRAQRRTFVLRGFGQDLRFAVRTIRRQSLPVVLAVICLALGIGATTSVLSIVDALLIRPLPFPNGDRLVQIGTGSRDEPVNPNSPNSFEDVSDWRTRQRSFTDIAVVAGTSVTLGTTDPVRAGAARASAALWTVLGVRPERGRLFAQTDDKVGAPNVVVVSNGFAARTFGGVDSAVGRTLTIDGRVHDVIGVIANQWRFPETSDIWMPLARAPAPGQRGNRWLTAIAQLRPGVSLDAARRDMSAVATAVSNENAPTTGHHSVALAPMRERYVGAARQGIGLAGGAALVVLLVACANVACLQLARGSARAKELAVRAALGAARPRIVRQLLTENVLLAFAGGVGGVGLGVWGSTHIGAAIATSAPSWMTFRLNVTVLVATTIISIAAGILFGMAPALGLTGRDTISALRAAGAATADRSPNRAQRVLAIVELALTVVLVTSATLAVESFLRLANVQPGYDATNIETFRLSLAGPIYDSSAARAAVVVRITDELERIPGVVSAAATSLLPMRDCCSRFGIQRPGTSGADGEMMVTGNMVTVKFFSTMRIPLVKGRVFTAADRAGSDAVILVNETMAAQFWPGEDPIGKVVAIRNGSRVVGVVGDVKQTSLVDGPEPQFYRPHLQDAWEDMSFAVRVKPGTVLPGKTIRAAVHAADPSIAVGSIAFLSQYVERALAPKRVFGRLFSVFAIVALALAIAGIYGVLAFQVSRRKQEIGLRVALGADRTQVVRMVLGEATRLGAAGIGLGVLGALAAARAMSHSLYGVQWDAPWRYGAIIALIVVVTIAAAIGPAWRASQVDPMRALRGD